MKLLEFTQKYPDEESWHRKIEGVKGERCPRLSQMRAQGMVLEGRQALATNARSAIIGKVSERVR